MKIRLKFIIHFLSVLALTSLNAQWKSVKPGNYTWGGAWAIDACDSATAVISVNYDSGGIILLTTDAGKSWQNLNWPRVQQWSSPVDISIKDANHIWAAIDDGRIIATSDGGKSWQVQFDKKNLTTFMDYIEMFNNNEGVALGDALSYGEPNDIFFINENLGWAVGNYIWKTTNGGDTWTEERKVNPNFEGRSIFFIDQNIGWMNGNSAQGFYRTINGGLTWDSLRTAFTYTITGIKFFNDKDGWVLSNSVLTKTSDGGLNWSTVSTSNLKTVKCISFLSKDIGWISGKGTLSSDPYTLIKTSDGGNTFQVVKTFSNETIIFNSFLDENNGWVVTNRTSGSETEKYIYRTSDGGSNWTVSKIGSTPIDKFIIIPYTASYGKNNYIIIGYAGLYFKKSFDNGETWSDINPGFSQVKTFFINENIGYSCSSDQTIYKTTNGGNTWVKLIEKVPEPLVLLSTTDGGSNWILKNNLPLGWLSGDTWRRVDFINKERGFFFPGSNYKSYIIPPDHNYKTLNGGLDWIKTNLPSGTRILKFYNENYGMTVAYKFPSLNQYYSLLCITKNGGITYDSTNLGATTVWDIEFLPGEPSKVWMSKDNELHFSPDSGKTWVNGNLYTGNTRVIDIVFVNKRIGWALCNGSGAVYRTENNAGIATDVVTKETIPTKFSLSQNYPNPFNPSTIISWQLAVSSYVTLKIYDLLGREVTTLVNEYKQAGYYNSQFSILNSPLPSGIYFYSLKAGNFTETKKMVLMK